jgi:hypothetical protein
MASGPWISPFFALGLRFPYPYSGAEPLRKEFFLRLIVVDFVEMLYISGGNS